MKVAINRCYGGFSLSEEAYKYLGLEWDGYGYAYSDDRTNPKLIECIEALGDKASGNCARVGIVKIPDDVAWEIADYDGDEWVEEVHRKWC